MAQEKVITAFNLATGFLMMRRFSTEEILSFLIFMSLTSLESLAHTIFSFVLSIGGGKYNFLSKYRVNMA
jgi:hypothetical protein